MGYNLKAQKREGDDNKGNFRFQYAKTSTARIILANTPNYAEIMKDKQAFLTFELIPAGLKVKSVYKTVSIRHNGERDC